MDLVFDDGFVAAVIAEVDRLEGSFASLPESCVDAAQRFISWAYYCADFDFRVGCADLVKVWQELEAVFAAQSKKSSVVCLNVKVPELKVSQVELF